MNLYADNIENKHIFRKDKKKKLNPVPPVWDVGLLIAEVQAHFPIYRNFF